MNTEFHTPFEWFEKEVTVLLLSLSSLWQYFIYHNFIYHNFIHMDAKNIQMTKDGRMGPMT